MEKEEIRELKHLVESLVKRLDSLEKSVSTTEEKTITLKASQSRVEPGEEDKSERIIDTPDFLPVHYLVEGALRQNAVCRIAYPTSKGTGFLVAPSIVMTNNHVITNSTDAQNAVLQFNYQDNYDGTAQIVDEWILDPARVFYTNVNLDFTIVAVKTKRIDPLNNTITAGSKWGFLPLPGSSLSSQFQKGKTALNIIQHPAGRKKEVCLHNNILDTVYTNKIKYVTDTQEGSSGSPVFTNSWDLVALHHAGGDMVDNVWLNNEGIRADTIVTDLRNHFRNTNPAILQELKI